jgi:hypothetical protein
LDEGGHDSEFRIQNSEARMIDLTVVSGSRTPELPNRIILAPGSWLLNSDSLFFAPDLARDK